MKRSSAFAPALYLTGLLLVGAIAAAGYLGWRWYTSGRSTSPEDMIAAMAANSRGIGELEHFKDAYPRAVREFEEAVRLAPDWLPARINLGIALLNQNTDESKKRSQQVFEDILQEHPDNPYAHFCLGILASAADDHEKARREFETVTRIDPKDAFGWYWLGHELFDDPERAAQCQKRALELDPYFSSAMYGVAMDARVKDANLAKKLLAEHQALETNAKWSNVMKVRYTEMGRYANAINPLPNVSPDQPVSPLPSFSADKKFAVQLAPGTRWAKADDFGKGAIADLQRAIRRRFGAVMVCLDYNNDGKLDLFLLGAVVEDGKVRDLLLRNDGDSHFTDVTKETGLAVADPSLGCCVGDFDNDGRSDLFITGAGVQRLYRNTGKGRFFEDVTAEAGLDKLTTVCLGAAFVDLDQDGDLDLVIAQYAATAEDALAVLESKRPPKGGGVAVYLNVGESPAVDLSKDPPPLKPRFREFPDAKKWIDPDVPVTSIVVSDLDCDRDLDLVLLPDRSPPAVVLNDRLLRFHRTAFPAQLVPDANWNGALVLDADHDRRFDLLLLSTEDKPLLLLNRCEESGAKDTLHYEPGSVDSPPLKQAQAVDLDLDGYTDVLGITKSGKPVLVHNEHKKLVAVPDALGDAKEWPDEVLAFAVADFTGRGYPDLVTWSESKGLELRVNQKNQNHGLFLKLSGHRHPGPGGEPQRSNADGVGATVLALIKGRWATVENSTLTSGLGQWRQPLVLGLGPDASPDVLLIRWPDLVWQAEFNVPTGVAHTLNEVNRKDTSCPILFAWNGKTFGFVTDFLGAGSMGEMLTGGGHRPPRPEESIKIEPEQLAPLDGRYVLKVCEPMIEVIYLDRLQLLAVDHPGDVDIFPDERFVSTGSPPTQDVLAFEGKIFPVRAKDHNGRDMTDTLRSWDRCMADGFKKRGWLGFAEEHWVELDFGDRLAKYGPNDSLFLRLAGWTDYAYPESIFAAGQAGIEMAPPVLDRLGPDGQWHTVIADLGFPAGLPRMMTADVTGKLTGQQCVLRIRTNLHVYWDQVFAAPLIERVKSDRMGKDTITARHLRVTPLDPVDAILEAKGCAKEFSPDGKLPTLYDYERRESFPVSRMKGRLTRLGTVTELLTERDDRFVIFGPGEEVSASFDARALPLLPSGWKRSFILRTWGYCKDASPFTETSETVEPLPFQDMKDYPCGPREQYPRDPRHEEYQRKYNIREMGSSIDVPSRCP
jgi:hypothetical protein